MALPRLCAAAVCALVSSELGVKAEGQPHSPSRGGMVSWAGATTALIESNAPVLRWDSTIEPGRPGLGSTAVLGLSVTLHQCNTATASSSATSGEDAPPCVPVSSWSSGEVRMTLHATWIGLCVFHPAHA